MKRTLLALSLLLIAVATGWLAALIWGGERRDLPPPPAVGAETLAALYATALPDAAGRMQSLGQWRGRVLVVNWWATWCLPCRDEMPEFSRLQTRYAARGVQFVGIAAEDADKVMAYARESPVAYPLLAGGQTSIKLSQPLGNAPLAVPFTAVLDRQGALRAAVLGRVSEKALERLLDGLAGE